MAKQARRPRPDSPEQSKRFIEMAREIGAHEERSEGDKLLKQLAKRKLEPRSEHGSGAR